MLKAVARPAAWSAVLAWMGLIFYLSDTPRLGEIAETAPLIRLVPAWARQWVYHGAMFGGLTALTYGALRVSTPVSWPLAALLALTVSIGYGAIDEWHQAFVPGRDADSSDVGRDAVGALSVTLLARVTEVAIPDAIRAVLRNPLVPLHARRRARGE